MEWNLVSSRRWFDFNETVGLFLRLSIDTPARLMLSSDGSLTRLLESLCLSPVEVEVKRQNKGQIEGAIADYLGVNPNQEAITREIWLVKGAERLVYARSVFLSPGLNSIFIEKLIKGEEPLGHLLREYNFLTLRNNWEIGIIQCRDIAEDLSVPADTSFWARRYKLLASPVKAGDKITAAIMEIFSPSVLDCSAYINLK